MKTIILTLTIALIAVLSSFEAKADCTDPWTSKVLMTPEFPACSTLGVEFCVKCAPTSADMEINIVRIIGACNGGVLASYLDYFQGRILANYAEFCLGAWTPCPTKIEIIIRKPLCMYESDEDPGDFLYCNASYCALTYLACTNDQDVVEWDLIDSEVEGNLECSELTWEDDPDPGVCFKLMVDCD